jgi:hypothetical protein
MVERLIRTAANFLVLVASTMAVPFLMWWAHGHRYLRGIDSDAVDYIRLFGVPLLPCAMVMWYIVASHVVLGRRSSFFVQFLVFATTVFVEYMLLSRGIWI